MSYEPMTLFKKILLFVFCTLQTEPCGQVTRDKQVLWLLFSHLVVLHSTNYDSPAGAIAYMGLLGFLTSGDPGFNSLHPVPSGATNYFWFSKNAVLEKHQKEHRAGYAWQQRLKVTQEVSEQRTTRRSVSYPVHSKVMGSPGAETKSPAIKLSNYEII